jgi:hypothetical protein
MSGRWRRIDNGYFPGAARLLGMPFPPERAMFQLSIFRQKAITAPRADKIFWNNFLIT